MRATSVSVYHTDSPGKKNIFSVQSMLGKAKANNPGNELVFGGKISVSDTA